MQKVCQKNKIRHIKKRAKISLCVRQMGYMDEKVPEMSCCDICMGHIDKKIIKSPSVKV